MFREMRRKDKQLTMEESIEIIKNNEIGVLSTICENGYPYGVPLNYVYYNDSIYFHSAKKGQKLDNIKSCDKVSFCVYSDVELLPDKFDTNYKSVILFGKATEVSKQEKEEALFEFIKKYSNKFIEEGKDYINKAKDAANVYKINIEHITGKAQK
ncbi:pyridoxamine 5'-phosphate oxidase family protein [Sedimentibacter sp.]|uniref:pyridoxamine 5'-phosphate oxidase family protein n=1 Tax=Sedimentibacter sp. TaxID=1960295 RepID=UPI0028AEF8A6|nr:pyridoxamine 5'-phosphate oxidase family protein [Sedimentibacter sp.]